MLLRSSIASLTRGQRLILIGLIIFNAFIITAALLLLWLPEPEVLPMPDVAAPCEANAALSFRQ